MNNFNIINWEDGYTHTSVIQKIENGFSIGSSYPMWSGGVEYSYPKAKKLYIRFTATSKSKDALKNIGVEYYWDEDPVIGEVSQVSIPQKTPSTFENFYVLDFEFELKNTNTHKFCIDIFADNPLEHEVKITDMFIVAGGYDKYFVSDPYAIGDNIFTIPMSYHSTGVLYCIAERCSDQVSLEQIWDMLKISFIKNDGTSEIINKEEIIFNTLHRGDESFGPYFSIFCEFKNIPKDSKEISVFGGSGEVLIQDGYCFLETPPAVKNLIVEGQVYNLIDDEAVRREDVDTSVIDGSDNLITSRAIKSYVDSTRVGKLVKNTKCYNFGSDNNTFGGSGGYQTIFGENNSTTSGSISRCTMIIGRSNSISTNESMAVGAGLQSGSGSSQALFIGRFNSPKEKSFLTVGNGDSLSVRSNVFRVDSNGNIYCTKTNTSGADYAEYFEWADGNPLNEDRIGYFIALTQGDKIKIAEPEDNILGVISGMAAVAGDAYEDQWKGMYETDIFGRFIYEDVEVTENVGTDEEGNDIFETSMVHRRKLNPNYDTTQEYKPRSERPEWATVGLLGKVVVIDDGTCTPGGKCVCAATGIATVSLEGYHVLRRLDESHILILLK